MKRVSPPVLLLTVILLSLSWCSSAGAESLQTTLDKHDPTIDPAPNIKLEAASISATIASIASETKVASNAQLQQIYEKLLGILEKVTKIVEGLVDTATKVAKDAAEKSKSSKGSQEYTVVSGDSLWAIASRFLGDGSKYWDIVEANKDKYPSLVKNPNLIYPGWVLTIPGGSGTTSPGSNNGDNKPGNNDPGSGDATGVAAKVAQVAASFPSRYNGYQKFPYAAGTEGGNLGCANVVSAALKEAGVPVWSLNVTGVKNGLLGLKAPNNWKIVHPPPYQPGDVVCWSAPSGSIHGHIGIVCKNGNSLMAMNNSSGKRKPVFSSIEHRAIACVVRKA